MKNLFLLILLSLAITSNAVEIDLIARANIYGSYKLPDTSYILNSTIRNSKDGSVAFNFTTVEEEQARMGLWIRNDRYPNGKVLYKSKVGDYISDPSFNDKGNMVFAVYNEIEVTGLYLYNAKEDSFSRIAGTSEDGYISLREPLINNKDKVLFRVSFKSGEKAILLYSKGEVETIASDKEAGIAYLFGARFFNGNQVVLKVREGSSLSESQPDTIRVYKANGSFVRMNYDNDFDEDSVFSSFNNSIGGHFSSKYISFVANLKNGKRVLIRQSGENVEVIATEGEGGIGSLEYFTPSVNESGNLAFRAINSSKKRAIFFYDGFVVRELISDGELISTDQSTAVIHSNNGPSFGGGVTINASNEIVFQSRIYTKYKKEALGTAVIKITP